MALEVPNKELTPQMERHGAGCGGDGGGVGGEGVGWCEGEKEWLAAGKKVVSSGLWNQELFALYSVYAPAPPPQHPHLHPCFLTVRPLLCSGLAGMLAHPLYISHPSLSCKKNMGRNKEGNISPVSSLYYNFCRVKVQKQRFVFCGVSVYLSTNVTV